MGSDPLLPDLENALFYSGVSPTAFGLFVNNDTALVPKLRAGRRVKKVALRRKIEQAIATLFAKGKLYD